VDSLATPRIGLLRDQADGSRKAVSPDACSVDHPPLLSVGHHVAARLDSNCMGAFYRPRPYEAETLEGARRLAIGTVDNANGMNLRSDTLASVLSERPAGVRVPGEARMVLLNSNAFIAVTGNGLHVTEARPSRRDALRISPQFPVGAATDGCESQ
jgi:hypothetical protein